MIHRKCILIMSLLFSIVLVWAVSMSAFSAIKENGKQELAKVTKDTDLRFFNGNRIFSYLKNDGTIVTDDFDSNAGMYWPSRASLKTINYCSGLWISGKVNGVPVTACAGFGSEWAPGKVLPDGTPDKKDDPKYKLYKINKSDMFDPLGNSDWMNWPVDQGAPWIDSNGNGIYEPLEGDMPDLLGDQMIWYVMNDLNTAKHNNLFSSMPIGLECKVTVWGYNRPDEFGDMMFAKFQIYNVKSTTVDSCYLGIWADIDLGSGSDDFSGCDTTLGLGYCYNDGEDAKYGTACPAIGYDFFQGAIVPSPGDTAKAFGRRIPDYKNLEMNVFISYVRGDVTTPGPETALECWNYMSGLHHDGTKYINNLDQEIYPARVFDGDPVTGTGWIDALQNSSGDRRNLQTCGPFTLAPGDSQEIVTACVIAQGTDHLNSIIRLKYADRKAQTAYDIDFRMPPSPGSPVVSATGLDGKVVLTWDDTQEDYEAIDLIDIDSLGNPTLYTFQGYNVYQFETETGEGQEKLIATYDITDLVQDIDDFEFIPSIGEVVEHTVQFGTDSGIQRYHVIENDPLRANSPLVNNRPYYFAVTVYSYNPQGIPRTLESPKTIVTVYPQQPFGQRIQSDPGDSIAVSHSKGLAEANVEAFVVDPAEAIEAEYKVTFDSDTTWTTDTTYAVSNTWSLLRDETTVLVDSNFSEGYNYRFVDGMMIKVTGSFEHPKVLGGFSVAPVDNKLYYYINDYGINLWAETGRAVDTWKMGTGTTDITLLQNDIELRFTGGEYEYQVINDSLTVARVKDGTGSIATFVGAKFYDIADHPMNPNPGSSDYFTVRIPFEVWDVERNVQLNILIYDRMQTLKGTLYAFNPYDRMYCWVSAKQYQETVYDADNLISNDGDLLTWNLVFLWAYWTKGDVVTLTYPNPIIPGTDEFIFSMVGLGNRTSEEYCKFDIEKINVFPNPYFGANVEERQILEHFVRFTHLPSEGVTIRIYTLAGELIRTIEHDNGTQFETWNLQNEYNIPVASGMYIVHVDCGNLGEKILKLALIIPEERLRQY